MSKSMGAKSSEHGSNSSCIFLPFCSSTCDTLYCLGEREFCFYYGAVFFSVGSCNGCYWLSGVFQAGRWTNAMFIPKYGHHNLARLFVWANFPVCCVLSESKCCPMFQSYAKSLQQLHTALRIIEIVIFGSLSAKVAPVLKTAVLCTKVYAKLSRHVTLLSLSCQNFTSEFAATILWNFFRHTTSFGPPQRSISVVFYGSILSQQTPSLL